MVEKEKENENKQMEKNENNNFEINNTGIISQIIKIEYIKAIM